MTGDGVNVFASKEYHFLYWLSRLPCVTLEGQPVIRLSQIELADQYGSVRPRYLPCCTRCRKPGASSRTGAKADTL